MCRPAQFLVSSIGSTTYCPALTMSAMSACRKLMWLQANLWGPLFKAALSCVAIQGRVWSTMGTPQCWYWHSRPLAGWFTCVQSVRSPWPLFTAANCSMPMMHTSSLFICFLGAIMSIGGSSHLLLGCNIVVDAVVAHGLLEMVGCGSEFLVSSLLVTQSFQCSLH